MRFTSGPYDLEGHIREHGSGDNSYRGEDFAQPRVLVPGDVLSNGWKLIDDPRVVGNGGIELHFLRWTTRRIAARLPLQLQSGRKGVLPADLQVGAILQTGDVVLSSSRPSSDEERHDDQNETTIFLTGGFNGHKLSVPADLELAVADETFPPDPETVFGAFVLKSIERMHEDALRELPRF